MKMSGDDENSAARFRREVSRIIHHLRESRIIESIVPAGLFL